MSVLASAEIVCCVDNVYAQIFAAVQFVFTRSDAVQFVFTRSGAGQTLFPALHPMTTLFTPVYASMHRQHHARLACGYAMQCAALLRADFPPTARGLPAHVKNARAPPRRPTLPVARGCLCRASCPAISQSGDTACLIRLRSVHRRTTQCSPVQFCAAHRPCCRIGRRDCAGRAAGVINSRKGDHQITIKTSTLIIRCCCQRGSAGSAQGSAVYKQ